MKLLLVIEADTNDADYITEANEITPEQLEQLLPVFEAIKNFKPYLGSWLSDVSRSSTHRHNWSIGDCLREDMGEKSPEELYADFITEEQVELFNDFAPFGEDGIHTITSIKVLKVESETSYL